MPPEEKARPRSGHSERRAGVETNAVRRYPHQNYTEFSEKIQPFSELFRAVQERVTAQEAAERYGLEVRRGKALCCFHPDRHPSMSFKGQRFRCWSCGASGDAIDLTAHLLGLAPVEALRRLNQDFGLGLTLDAPATPEAMKAAQERERLRQVRQRFDRWRKELAAQLNGCLFIAHTAFRDLESLDNLTEAQSLAVQWEIQFAIWCDTLMGNDLDEQMKVFRQRKEVDDLCRRILNDTPPKSMTA